MKGKKFSFVARFVVALVVIFVATSALFYFYFGKTEIGEIKENLLGLNYSQGEIPNYFLENNLAVELSKEAFRDLYKDGFLEEGLFYTAGYKEENGLLKSREDVFLTIWGTGKNGMVFNYTINQLIPLKQRVREISTNIGGGVIKIDIIKDPDSAFFYDCLIDITIVYVILMVLFLVRRKIRYNIASAVRW